MGRTPWPQRLIDHQASFNPCVKNSVAYEFFTHKDGNQPVLSELCWAMVRGIRNDT